MSPRGPRHLEEAIKKKETERHSLEAAADEGAELDVHLGVARVM